MHRTLSDIELAIADVEEKIDQFGGELSDEAILDLQRQFDDLQGAIEEKIDRYIAIIERLEFLSESRKAESQRIRKRADISERSASFMRQVLVDLWDRRGWDKSIETPLHKVTLADAGGKQSIQFYSENIPDEYARVKTIREPDREKIRADLEQGADLPFARLLPRKRYLKIS